jgi:cation transport ATPase
VKTLSDKKDNDELRALLDNIRVNGNHSEDVQDEEPLHEWSHDDIDRLLNLTGHKAPSSNDKNFQKSTPTVAVEKSDNEVTVKKEISAHSKAAVDISQPSGESNDNSRIKAIMTEESPRKKNSALGSVIGTAKNKLSGIFSDVKSQSQSTAKAARTSKVKEEEKRFFLSDEDEDFDDEEDAEINEQNNIEASPIEENETFSEPENHEFEDNNEDDGKTKVIKTSQPKDAEEATAKVYIEKPGIVIKKSEPQVDSELEGAPTIIAADNALDETKIIADRSENKQNSNENEDDLKRQIREAMMEGQIVLHGFEDIAEKPEQIDEAEAEQELFEKRREKIRKFTLFGEEEGADAFDSEEESEKIEELFDTNDDKPHRKEPEHTFSGVEYSQQKDSRRVLRYLNSQKKKSFNKLITLGVFLLASVIIGIASAAGATIAGDRILTIFSNFILIILSLIVSNQTIILSFEQLKRKKVNINTAVSFAAILSFVQNLLMLILYFADANTVSVFSGTGVAALFIAEISNYVTNARTIDAVNLCIGENKNKLYSMESINDDKDALELGKNVKASSPRIRYSCKTKFPSHLIELCTSETSADKTMKSLLPIIALLAVINFVVTWVLKGDFATGFAAFTITMTMSVPACGVLLIQLPLRWMNKRLNYAGGLISCQESVNEICKTNTIIIDSKDLFDQNACSMLGFKDFKNVRVDDAMLYAAAMVIRSGGPLTGVFDQMVINRRDILPTIKSFNYEEKLGVSGWIYGQKVILGNRSLMENHNVRIPDEIDEEKYRFNGHEVMFLAIAHTLAAMIVLDYAPNMKIAGYLKKLRDSGVSVLVRNCDPNVTETMISETYGIRLKNIKIINSSSARVFKKYKTRTKPSARALSIFDGSAYMFMRSLCTAATLKNMFRFSKMLMYIGTFLSFAIVFTLAILNVIADLPAVFAILIQLMMAAAFTAVMRLICIK